MSRLASKAISIASVHGTGEMALRIAERLAPDAMYRLWYRWHCVPRAQNVAIMRRRIGELRYRPVVSVLMPVYNTPEKWLRAAIDSVRRQIYPRWELCIADDRSTLPHVASVLRQYAATDSRIRICLRDTNGHISAASNSALEMVTGQFTALLDHDDELPPDALYWVAEELADSRGELDLIYSDEDKIDERGRVFDPYFKSDWNPDLFTSQNFISHLGVYRSELLRAIGGFRRGFEGSQDYDVALRVIERSCSARIRHIPRVLYHWRAIPGSVALDPREKTYAHARARYALAEHIRRTGQLADVVEGYASFHRVIYPVPQVCTQVIHTRGLVKEWNAYADACTADVLVFQSPDLRPADEAVQRELISQALRPEIGIVGARIISADRLVLNAGMVLGPGPTVNYVFRGLPDSAAGNIGRAHLVQNYAAVGGGCIAVRREVFQRLGGWSADFSDRCAAEIDLCLRAWENKYRVVWTPYATLYSTLTATSQTRQRIESRDLERLYARWPAWFAQDRYANPNVALVLQSGGFVPAWPPAVSKQKFQ